jgi:hypothetical protein
MFSVRRRYWPTARATLTRWGYALFGTAYVLLGCQKTPQATLTDSERRQFVLTCPKSGPCSVATSRTNAEAPPSKAGETKDFTLRATGRVVGICGPVAAGQSPNLSECRPLVCQSNAECPPAQGLSQGVCINQLCTEPSHEVISDDAVMLCLAGTGAPNQTPSQAERFALGLNCGSPCRIPKPCRSL